jgi:hypothetical protein
MLSRMYSFWKTAHLVSGHAREDCLGCFAPAGLTSWSDEQPKKRLGDVKPEPDSFSFPWKVLKVDLIYDTPISMNGADLARSDLRLSILGSPYLVEPIYGGLDLDAYPRELGKRFALSRQGNLRP